MSDKLIEAFNQFRGQTFLGALECYLAIEFVFEKLPGQDFNLLTIHHGGKVDLGHVDIDELPSYKKLRG